MHNKLFQAGITGIGTYTPDQILTNADLERMVDTNDKWIQERCGVRERRISKPEESTSDLAVKAALRAIASAEIEPKDIDLIILATSSPDMLFPASGCLVQDKIGAKRAAAFDLSAGCTGFIYGLVVGSQFVANGTYDNVLVIGAEIISRFVNWQDRKTCVLFGDGAGAVILQRVPDQYGVLATSLGSDGSGSSLLYLPAGGSQLPASHETVDLKLHYLKMNGREIFKFAVKIMDKTARQVLTMAGLKEADIDLLIPHQANIRIIEAIVKRLEIPREKVLVNIDRYGNTSTASIPLALEEALINGRIKNGNHLALVSFGTGLTWGAAIIRWYQTGKNKEEMVR